MLRKTQITEAAEPKSATLQTILKIAGLEGAEKGFFI